MANRSETALFFRFAHDRSGSFFFAGAPGRKHNGNPLTLEGARKLFQAQYVDEHGSNASAVCFAAFLCNTAERKTRFLFAAMMGHSVAQTKVASRLEGEERVHWAQKAALQRDTKAMETLASCMVKGWV